MIKEAFCDKCCNMHIGIKHKLPLYRCLKKCRNLQSGNIQFNKNKKTDKDSLKSTQKTSELIHKVLTNGSVKK